MKKLSGKELLHRAMQPQMKKVHKKTTGASLQGSYVNPQSRAFGGAGTKGIQSQAPISLQGKKIKKHSKKAPTTPLQQQQAYKHKKGWIAGAIKKPGALHSELGVKKGDKIPTKKLNAAAGKKGLVGKRARLAQTLESFHHKHKKHMKEVKKSNKDLVQWAKEEEKEPEHKKHKKEFTGGEKKATFDQKHCKVCGKSHAKHKA